MEQIRMVSDAVMINAIDQEDEVRELVETQRA